MHKVQILDCTLRDGGYVNDWHFGKDVITGFIEKISKTNIECVELGFVKGDTYDENRSVFPDFDSVKNVLKNKNDNMKYFLMYDMSAPVDMTKFRKCDNQLIDGVRVIFKKDKIDAAYDVCRQFIQYGYLVSVNFVNTDLYTDDEIIEAIKKYNELNPYSMAIVDTFGSMKNNKFLHLVELFDKHLDKNIILTYHAHNNLQQAYLNATSFVDLKIDRDIMIDASVFGMGRGAGNLNIELFAEYMNDKYNKNYHIVPLLEIMDEYLQDIYKTKFWGYSLPLYISATLNVHPNYAIYFAEKNTLTEKAMYDIMKSMTYEDKIVYKKNIAEDYYINYMNTIIDDSQDILKLKNEFSDKTVLIIAPGKSINEEKQKIKKLMSDENIISISVNFYDTDIKTDYLFSSNMRRYNKLDGKVDCKTIITSNMKEAKNKNYVLNFYDLAIEKKDIIDNSGLMTIKLLIKLGVKNVKIAGMDGYSENNPYVYKDENTHFDFSSVAIDRNYMIKKEIENLKNNINIEFITDSIYR